MKRGLTPILSLAVVMALALAAVFGSMSLAQPAYAGTPSGLKATGAASSVILTFRDQTDIDNTEWEVQYRENVSGVTYTGWLTSAAANVAVSEPADSDMVTITVSVLSDGSEYCFRVRENDSTESPLSPSSAAGPICATPNEAPDTTAVSVTVETGDDGGTLKVEWDSTGSKQDAWQYKVDVDTTLDGTAEKMGTWKMVPDVTNDDEGEFVIPDLASQPTEVNIRAVAVYSTGNIEGTIVGANTDLVVPAPAKPVATAKGGDGEITLSWRPAYSDSGIKRWEYRYGETSDFDDNGAYTDVPVLNAAGEVVEDTETNYATLRAGMRMVVIDELDNGTDYTFQVRAVSEGSDATADTLDVDGETSDKVMVTPIMPTQSTLKAGGIPNPPMLGVGESITKNLAMYFTQGAGSGDIDRYEVVVAGTDNVAVTGTRNGEMGAPDYTTTGMITITGLRDGLAVITVTGVDDDGNDFDDVPASFTVNVGAEAADVPAPNAPNLRTTTDNTAYDAADNAGSVTIHWADPFDDRITRWQYAYQPSSPGDAADNWMTIFSGEARSATISGLMVGTEYTVKVRGLAGSVEGAYAMVNVTPTKAAAPTKFVPNKPTIELSSSNPGKNARYTVRFNANNSYVPGVNDLIIQLTDEDFQVPSTIATSTVTIQAGAAKVANPADISVDDQEITLVLGDMDGDTDGVQGINQGENVTVVFRTAAGISNPTEGGDYEEMTVDGQTLNMVTIKRTIGLSEDEGGRGDAITVTGKGFKNGTTVTFVRMMGEGMTAADFASATSLCSATAGGDDIASCEFTVTSPLFKGGMNYINAFDGRSNMGSESEPFTLEPSITANPKGGSPGDSILVQLYDFGPNAGVESVLIARKTLCAPNAGGAIKLMNPCGKEYSAWTPIGSTSHMGEMTFRVVIPNDAPLGVQDLQVKTSGGNKNTTITIAGPMVTSTPSTVIANQRVSLVGNGFTSGAKISQITFAGDAIDSSRIASGNDVSVDGGGNWNASVDLPLNTSTVAAGTHALEVKDSAGRIGQVSVVVPERSVTITPDSGRVGTIAVVRGEHFPSKNDEGDSFNVVIVYGAANNRSTTVSTVPDASGRFEVQLRIPTTAAIPSTNDVSVSFGDADDGGPFTMNVTHEVPEGAITLSQSSGGPGTMVTISGEGFKAFVPVTSVTIGSVDISPAPRPNTDGNGMLEFDVLIPGLDTGIQTIEVRVGQTTASKGFTVTESGVHPGDIRPVSQALEPLGDNIVSAWHFNNDTKVWSFYDPTLAEGNTLTHMISGETYLIRVKSDQEVILNHDTRSLTCVGSNCWNQIVW